MWVVAMTFFRRHRFKAAHERVAAHPDDADRDDDGEAA
jgi:hypothetical protein